MWDGLFTLLSYSFVMGIASFLAGSLPLSFGLSQNHSRIISAIGTGLLVGTCLIIIIPEGIETLYSAGTPNEHSAPVPPANDHDHQEPHAWIGLSLVVGFILMYLIDRIPRHASSSGRRKTLHISLANLAQGPHRASSPSRAEEGDASDELAAESATPQNSATTVGLVIHAAADGIALAASSFLSQAATGFVVFLALMIHKAPAAFGLTSVLLKQGHTKRQARAHLIVFSLAAPVGAIGTWLLVNLIVGGKVEGEYGTKFATGLLLLFSGGTFLYVAMHTMQESGTDGHEDGANGYMNGQGYTSGSIKDNEGQIKDTMLVVVGMLLPLIAQLLICIFSLLLSYKFPPSWVLTGAAPLVEIRDRATWGSDEIAETVEIRRDEVADEDYSTFCCSVLMAEN